MIDNNDDNRLHSSPTETENTATGVYEITNSKSYKIIIDGQLMIIHDGKAYNVLGL